MTRDDRPQRSVEHFARCTACGWHGIPTYEHGRPTTRCPNCDDVPSVPGRNEPCDCGSGLKAKKCCHG